MSSAIEIATNFIKQWEGFRSRPYQDQKGVWTIGYGTTCIGSTTVTRLTPPVTEEQATSYMEADLATRVPRIEQCIKVPLNDNQMAALISFAYNEGVHALQTSTLLKLVNQGRFQEASKEFAPWVYAAGKVDRGLVNRRAAEAALFTSAPLDSVVEQSTSSTEDLNAQELERIKS